MKKGLITVICLFLVATSYAQSSHSCATAKSTAYERILKRTRAGVADNALMSRYDVNWYFLDIQVERNSTVIAGNVTIGAKLLAAIDTFCFELNSALIIDSVVYQNAAIHFLHTATTDICYVSFASTIAANTNVQIKIYYRGDASVVGGSAIGNGFSTGASPTWSNSVTWSLSEPYSAREWFPCKQFLQDKADSVWVYVTTNIQNKVGSNGILQGVDSLAGNKVRYRWQSHYPTDYYLISVAVAKYVEYTTYAHPTALANDSITILNYVYDHPACLPNFKPVIDSTAMMIEYFSDKLGLYPFYAEKYGHAMAPFSGGMEHQTMSSLGFFNFGLVAHELMHQWFGDYVTCATWSDIFVNEGFASYGEYLVYEQFRGAGAAKLLMQDVHTDVMDLPGGSIYFTDTTNVNRIFSSRLSYDKGNAVIHTLRFVLGDAVFFQSLKNYLAQKAYGTASIIDFKTSVEATAGISLTNFFDQWIYGEGYPTISAKYFTDVTNLYLRVEHAVSSTTPTFITPLEIKCKSALNGDTIIIVNMTTNNDTYIIPMGKLINGLEIDPNNWLLNKVGTITLDPTLLTLAAKDVAAQHNIKVYPNPSSEFFTIVNNSAHPTSFTVRNLLGEIVWHTYNSMEKQTFDATNYPSGVYILEIENKNGRFTQKLSKQ